jgi:putative transposase
MYRRNLPHWYPEGAAVFVTWRLFGALPPQKSLEGVKDGRAFVALDRTMDRAQLGPTWLRHPAVADVVSKVIEAAEADRNLCRLHSFVVMPNHVHVQITPYRALRQVTNWIKGVSARKANQTLNRTGQRFWQDESFDHWARSVQEFEKIERYILENPIRAGLVREAVDWKFSSAGRLPHTSKDCINTA